jgi:hypothetical protein
MYPHRVASINIAKHAAVLVASFLSLASIASAAPITYNVAIDTSSISGTAGALDFNFNPGPLVTQAASLQILNFTSDGTLAGSPVLTGDVAGALPATVTFDNGTPFNDYFEGFTFASALSFDVSLFGPALSAPDGTSTSGSTFAFSMFSDPAGTIPVLTSDKTNGFALTVSVNLDGSTTLTSFVSTGPSVPEPDSLALVATGLTITLGALFLRARIRA